MSYPDGITPELARQQWGPDTLAEEIERETETLAAEIDDDAADLSAIAERLERVAYDGGPGGGRGDLQQISAALLVVRAAIKALGRLV